MQQARRVAALKELQKVLRDDDKSTASTVHGLLPVMWPQTLGLLGDSNADVRQMAAPVVGMLGAMATRQGARSGKRSTSALVCICHEKGSK